MLCAREYPSVFQIQMAATACLFNLSKADLGNKMHPRILRDIVKTDLDAMETFPQHQQVHNLNVRLGREGEGERGREKVRMCVSEMYLMCDFLTFLKKKIFFF